MSEKKEEKKASELILERIEKLEKTLLEKKEAAAPPAEIVKPADPSEPAKGHKDLKELVDCPDCYPEIERLVTPKILKKYGESLKGQETVKCKGCGLHVRREEKNCPSCGSSEAE